MSISKYKLFNKYVYAYYSQNLIPDQINSLAIPKSEMEGFGFELNEFPEINSNNWYYLLSNDYEGVPKYMGLIALQCYAASMMQNDGETTAANYRSRFVELVGIETNGVLNDYFSETFDSKTNVQERIWSQAYIYFKSMNILLQLPDKKSYAGRNTQYPLSQVVLNYEDLKEYCTFYQVISERYDVIHFSDFSVEYERRIPQFQLQFFRSNNKKAITDVDKRIKLKQIFDYYISEDWEKSLAISTKRKVKSHVRCFLKIVKHNFTIFDEEFNEIKDSKVIFGSNGFVLFREDENYRSEFEMVQRLSKGYKYIIILKNENLSNIKELNSNTNCDLIIKDENFTLFAVENLTHLPYFLDKYIGEEYPIKVSGLRINRKRQYFVTNPPQILIKENYSYTLTRNGERSDNLQPLEIGNYTIKVNSFSNYSFEIVDLPKLKFCVPQKLKMLSFDQLCIDDFEKSDMFGFYVKMSKQDVNEELTINNWIKVYNGEELKTNSQILIALKQNKYG